MFGSLLVRQVQSAGQWEMPSGWLFMSMGGGHCLHPSHVLADKTWSTISSTDVLKRGLVPPSLYIPSIVYGNQRHHVLEWASGQVCTSGDDSMWVCKNEE